MTGSHPTAAGREVCWICNCPLPGRTAPRAESRMGQCQSVWGEEPLGCGKWRCWILRGAQKTTTSRVAPGCPWLPRRGHWPEISWGLGGAFTRTRLHLGAGATGPLHPWHHVSSARTNRSRHGLPAPQDTSPTPGLRPLQTHTQRLCSAVG